MSLRDDLHAHSFYLAGNGRWDQTFINLSENFGKRIGELSDIQEQTRNNPESFNEKLAQWARKTPQIPDKTLTRGLFEREVFALTRAIFAGEKRKVGDTWVTDGSVFNSFLHPDLKGTFTGRAILTYVEDDDMVYSGTPSSPGKAYTCRILEYRDSATIDGRKMESTLKYDEGPGKFNASWSERNGNKARLFIDTVSGQVIKCEMIASANVKVLPEMLLSQGLEGDGELRLEIQYGADVGKPAYAE